MNSRKEIAYPVVKMDGAESYLGLAGITLCKSDDLGLKCLHLSEHELHSDGYNCIALVNSTSQGFREDVVLMYNTDFLMLTEEDLQDG